MNRKPLSITLFLALIGFLLSTGITFAQDTPPSIPNLPAIYAPTASTYTITGNSDSTSACVGTVCPSLRSAIIAANANPGSTIVLSHGWTYSLSIPPSGIDDVTTGDLNINANTAINFGNVICLIPPCGATIQGTAGWNDRILNISSSANVQITNVTIKNGNASDYGGGIFSSGNLTLTNSIVISNTTTRDGGGIANYTTGRLYLDSTNVLSNTAGASTLGGAGGIYNMNTMVITNSLIANNQTMQHGGGILTSGTATLTNTSVMTNTAIQGGGGIYGYTGPLNVTGGAISSNTNTVNQGGGIYYQGSVTLNGTEVSRNKAQTDGAGIYIYGVSSQLNLTNATINNNQILGTGVGGGIRSNGTAITVLSTTINNNTSTGAGGGVYSDSGTLTMTNSTVSGNTAASNDGGGISTNGSSLTLSTSTIYNNEATNGNGGGISALGTPTTIITSTISTNRSYGTNHYGGGIWAQTGALTITASTLNNNTAPSGGGIYTNAPLNMVNSTVSTNSASTLNGGGIYQSGSSFSLTNTTVAGNQAPLSFGGGIYGVSVNPANLHNTLIAGNTASSGPDCAAVTFTSQGYNWLGIGDGCGLTHGVNGDIAGSVSSPWIPMLGPLANNGGSTQTHALLITSQAIDSGDPASCPTIDQRGIARPQYAHCDIGAYEYNGPANPAPAITSLNPSATMAGGPSFVLTINGSGFVSNSRVYWKGLWRQKTFVNSNQLTIQVSSADIASAGTASITVFNPTPGGGTSNSATFTITADPNAPNLLLLPFIQK